MNITWPPESSKKEKKNPRILNLRTPNWEPSFVCSIRFVTRFNLEAL